VDAKAPDLPSMRFSRAVGALSLALVLTQGGVVSSHVVEHGEVHATLYALVEQGAISPTAYVHIHRLYDTGKINQLSRYLDGLADRKEITAFLHVYLQTLLEVAVPMAGQSAPAPANYSGNGNVTKLGQLNPYAPFPYYGEASGGQLYGGVWGYAAAGREYALLTHSQGLAIIDVTDPTKPVPRQFIAGVGGRVHHDIDTYRDPASGRTYAYFGGQEGEHLFSIDLSYLPGTIPSSAIRDLGRTNYAHTLQVTDGLLFTNGAGSRGCQVFDVRANPANPPLLAQGWKGTGRDCHDSFSRDNLLYSADGYSTQWRIVDISGIRSGVPPTLIGETAAKPGMYAHSGWLSDDSRYLFTFEESNVEDINIFDVSNPSAPLNVKTFQWSGDATAKSKVHNGQVKGNLLYVAYYEAGFRVFDIADPLEPVEVGKYETWRDPDGDGTFNRPVTGKYNGAWNVYTQLPSGNILVSDMLSGLFVFRVTPLSAPDAPAGLVAVAENRAVRLSWSPSSGATTYNVRRAAVAGGPYALVLTGATATNVTDTGLTNGTRYYYVVSAVNAGGESPYSNEVWVTPSDSSTLTVTLEGTGAGRVATSPVGISCPGTCEQAFTRDSSVTLTATANAGSTFMTWSGACGGTGACVLKMDVSRNVAATFAPSGRDLVEAAVSNPPPLVSPVTAFNVTNTVRNQGSLGAGSSVTRYYLSLDAVKDKTDRRLSGSRTVPALPVGTESSGTVSVNVPASMPVGTYRLIACADDTRIVQEILEGNNCTAAATTVTVALPDLIETTLSTSAAAVGPGAVFTVTDRARNTSATVTAAASTTRYYLSADVSKDPGDVPLKGTRSVPSLAPGGTSTGSRTVTTPLAAAVGTYYVVGCADDLLKVQETSETNNCVASATTLKVAWPDLVTTSVSNPPSGAVRGSKFTITDTVTNKGDGPASASTTRYYLSVDGVKNAADLLLTGTRSVAGLQSNAASTGSRVVAVPTSAPPGTYVVLACADDGSKVGESNNANNCRASGMSVVIHP
jgi:choice-of-anchor B domain-containing protein